MKQCVYITSLFFTMSMCLHPLYAQGVSVGAKAGGSYTTLLFNFDKDLRNDLTEEEDNIFRESFFGKDERNRAFEKDPADYTGTIGAHIGFFISIHLGAVSLQPEFFYTRQGGRKENAKNRTINLPQPSFNDDGSREVAKNDDGVPENPLTPVNNTDLSIVSDVSDVTDYDLDYVAIPFLIKLHIGDIIGNDALGWNVFVGPQLSFLVNTKITTERDGVIIGEEESTIGNIDVSGIVGLGYDFSFGLGIDVRYGAGLSNVNDDSRIETKNQVIQLAVSYKFFDTK